MKDRRENVILGLAVVGLVAFAFPVRVLGCSCVSPGPSEEETILQGFCSSQDVYEGTVAGATCNCYPSPSATKELYCLNFSLNVHGGLEPSLVSRVTCENLVTLSSSVTTCSEVLSALAGIFKSSIRRSMIVEYVHVDQCQCSECTWMLSAVMIITRRV